MRSLIRVISRRVNLGLFLGFAIITSRCHRLMFFERPAPRNSKTCATTAYAGTAMPTAWKLSRVPADWPHQTDSSRRLNHCD